MERLACHPPRSQSVRSLIYSHQHMSFIETIMAALFPDRCVGCLVRGSLVCTSCLRSFAAAPSAEDPAIACVYAYRDARVRALIRLLKYKNTRHVAGRLGPCLASVFMELLGEEGRLMPHRVLVVPMPLSRKRLRSRGYNQSALLARAMVRSLPALSGVKLDEHLLEKRFETRAQAEIGNRAARLKNLRDCFRVCDGRTCAGEAIVLVDDVVTTGATFAAARRALEAAGFARVYLCALAH